MEYQHDRHSVHLIVYHLIFCPKYRQGILVGPVKKRLEAIIDEVMGEQGYTSLWIWKSTVLTSLEGVLWLLRIYNAIPAERIRVFTAASKEEMVAMLNHENNGLASGSLTAAQFLRDRHLHVQGASAQEMREKAVSRSTAVAIDSSTRENRLTSYAADARSIDLLEQKRLQIEQGPGGDHDTPYRFALPISTPQLLAWTRLLARVQAGDLQP